MIIQCGQVRIIFSDRLHAKDTTADRSTNYKHIVSRDDLCSGQTLLLVTHCVDIQ